MMDTAEARAWLDDEWTAALAANDTALDPDIDKLANSKGVAVRYALVTQLLGKISDPGRDLRIVQLSEGSAGAWDARSFSTAVIVPWVSENQNVIGTSSEPYASKPLRRERLEHNMPDVRYQKDWNALVALFDDLEDASEKEVRQTFRLVLRSLTRRLASQIFSYAIPQRISLRRLQEILEQFLSTASGGLRPQAVTAALMRTVGDVYSLFSKVESQGINESDAASGVPGDILCYSRNDPERISIVVEVKDMELTLGHVSATSVKAKQADAGFANLLFAVPGIRASDRDQIAARVATEWASGMNIYTISIPAMVDALFILADESCRIDLIREIGKELDRLQNQPARKAWHDLLLTTEGNQ